MTQRILLSMLSACGLLLAGLVVSAEAQAGWFERGGDFLEEFASTPAAPLPPGVVAQKDLAYGPERRQRLDVYREKSARNAPVIVMVHGGGWRRGDKDSGRVVDNKLARWVPRGFVFVSVNYRLMPEADPLVQADDVAAALNYVRARASAFGGDPARIVLMGHSAGAHLVSLVAADPGHWSLPPWLGTVALDSATYDLVTTMSARHFRLYDRAFGDDTGLWHAASPMERLKPGAQPMLLVCSSQRPDRPCEQARRFAAKAESLGIRAPVLPEAMSHGEINGDLGLPGAYTREVEAFLKTLDPSLADLLKP